MEAARIILGYCPTRRDVFSKSEALRYSKLVKEKIRPWCSELVDIDDINSEGLLFDEPDIAKTVEKMRAAKVDALFFPHCNFGSEVIVANVARALGVPVLIWGPRDDAPEKDGVRQRDTQCGLFATGKVLRRFNVPFTYLTNTTPDDKYFEDGFKKFIAVASVVKSLRDLRILQISTRPTYFMSVIVNENELMERFGIQVTPIALPELIAHMDEIREEGGADYTATFKLIKENISPNTPDDQIAKLASLKAAIRSLAARYNCRAAALQCWSALQDVTGIMPCLANSLLSDDGLPCACETDINGAITAVMLQAATLDTKPHFFADVTVRHPTDDNIELLWHCGPFPYSLAKDKKKANAAGSWILESRAYGTCEREIKGGDVTLARFDGDHGNYSLLIGEGEGVDGPFTRGTYMWLKVKDWPKWEHKIVKGPYIHHIVGIHGKYADVLLEACNYINGLCPDPVEPSLCELEARWR